MLAAPAYQNAEGVKIEGIMDANGAIQPARTYTVITAQARAWNPRFYFLPIKKDEMNRNSKLVQNPLY